MINITSRGLKEIIIVKITILLVLLWSIFLSFWLVQIRDDFLSIKLIDFDLKEKTLLSTINEEKSKLILLLSNLSNISYEYKRESGIFEYKDILKKYWSILATPHQVQLMQYYDTYGSLMSDYGTNKLNQLSEDIFKILSLNEGRHGFFHCEDVCYLNIIQPAALQSFDYGFLRVSIPVDELVARYKRNNSGHLVSYSQPTTESTAKIDSYSSINLLDIIKDNITAGSGKDYALITKNNQKYLMKETSPIEDSILKFIILEDITIEYNNMHSNFIKVIIITLSSLLLTIGSIYLLLNNSLLQLLHLTKIVPLIGKGHFVDAKRELETQKYINKPYELDSLYTVIKKIIEEIESNHTRLTYLANYDALTGLLKRREFNRNLDLLAANKESMFAIVILDLNYFKIINDTMGHSAGDTVLKALADVLKKFIRETSGVAARLGGDEFALLIPFDERKHVVQQLNNLSNIFFNTKIPELNINQISVSMGASIYPTHSSDIDSLILYADAAMYENKKGGSGEGFHIYNGQETLLKKEKESKHWNSFVSTCLGNDGVHVFFQAIYNADTLKAYSYEVLVRFYDRELNIFQLPSNIIPHAEKNMKIVQIDKTVIEKALKIAKDITPKPRLMFNLSSITLNSTGIKEHIKLLLDENNYPPELIVIEVTESVQIEDMNNINSIMRDLKGIGIKFALDDFGSGYSSFTYLNSLELDYLKIDKKIVMDLSNNSSSHHTLDAILFLTKKLGIKTIAEGIESKKILDEIRNYDIDLLQGFHLSMPQDSLLKKTQNHAPSSKKGARNRPALV